MTMNKFDPTYGHPMNLDSESIYSLGATYLSTKPKSWRDRASAIVLDRVIAARSNPYPTDLQEVICFLADELDHKEENTIHLDLTNPTPLASLAERLRKGHLDE